MPDEVDPMAVIAAAAASSDYVVIDQVVVIHEERWTFLRLKLVGVANYSTRC